SFRFSSGVILRLSATRSPGFVWSMSWCACKPRMSRGDHMQTTKPDGTRSADCLTITVAEAARRLGVGRNHAYEAARQGQIPSIRIGRRVLVPLAAFERMLRGEK